MTKARTLHYPKIGSTRNCRAARCVAFEKYDGTNTHWRWERNFGWHAFGTRRDEFNLSQDGIQQFATTHARLRECVEVFTHTLADGLARVFRENSAYTGFTEIVAFAEFFGPRSFAGLHKEEDPKELRLFDIYAAGFGIIGPKQFAADYGHLYSARVVYEGRLTGRFAEAVREGSYGINEGVVCKGGAGGDDVWMAKIKTYDYMARLKEAFAERWEDFWE